MTLASGTRLGPYEILSPLAAGGMGEVYRARDRKLDRDVAIKVLPESVASDPNALARFEREAKAVAALSHPNILSIFDFGTHDGISYAVMELLEGETLRGKLEAGPIPHKQAVDYALQMARGLTAAHERGVVHRDLKPENVFVTKDGHVKILDFGLARRLEPAAPGQETSAPTDSAYTAPGTVLGTVGYMSPEQVRGLPVDHRSDIFSFGAILYELLSGRRAFQGSTPADTMSAILKEDPPDPSESKRGISPALERIVRHCLEKSRDRRFQSSRDIEFALEEMSSPNVASAVVVATPTQGRSRVLIGVAAMILLAATTTFLIRRSHSEVPTKSAVKRIAVLPFENLGAPEDDYFADGIADDIRGRLTSLPGYQVIARASSTPYKKSTKTPKQIAQELDVGYLLTATIRWEKKGAANRVHVSPELVEVSGAGTPTSRWQQPFDAALTDVFQVQADIASRTAEALGSALGADEEKRLSNKPTQNLAAYDAFLRGEEAWRSEAQESSRRAIGFYERAVALDPRFAQAWAGLSLANSGLYTDEPSSEVAERAHETAEKAKELAPEGVDGYLALGTYLWLVRMDFERALEQLENGQRRAPSNSDILDTMGATEVNLARWNDGVEHYRQAERSDPRSADPKVYLAAALIYLRRYSDAREVIDRGLQLKPASPTFLWQKAWTFLGEGNTSAARTVLKAAPRDVDPTALVAAGSYQAAVWALDEEQRELLLRLTPSAFDNNRPAWAISLAQAYALKGDAPRTRTYAEEARRTADERRGVSPRSWTDFLGLSLAYLGRKEEAIREGERALSSCAGPKDGFLGVNLRNRLARIYVLVGEPEKAMDEFERLMKTPSYHVSPGLLKIDPTLDSLRKNPRFQKLVAGAP